MEEFEEILGCPLGGRKPYHFSGFYPSLARISKIVKVLTQELDRGKQVENGVVGVLRKCLEAKASSDDTSFSNLDRSSLQADVGLHCFRSVSVNHIFFPRWANVFLAE